MKKNILLLLFLSAFILNGCLIVSRRIFTYTIKSDGKVELVIQYIDIRSAATTNGIEPDTGFVEKDDEESLSEEIKDYQSLVKDFYVSDYFASCYPRGKVTSRKLYETDGQLNGEVHILFDNLKAAGIEKVKKTITLRSDSLCGYIHYIDSIAAPQKSTPHVDSIAQYYLFSWPKKTKTFAVEVVPYFPFGNSISLLDQWKKDK
ncbi:MAG: hypothetical protein ACHQF2_10640 [Flavobacteriales bacterium]